jgi:glutamate synthase domain-containing protein 3
MTGGRAYLYDPDGRHLAALDPRSVHGTRLSTVAATREDGAELQAELRDLLDAHREAGSALAARLLAERASLEADVWLIEPLPVTAPAGDQAVPTSNSIAASSTIVPAVPAA